MPGQETTTICGALSLRARHEVHACNPHTPRSGFGNGLLKRHARIQTHRTREYYFPWEKGLCQSNSVKDLEMSWRLLRGLQASKIILTTDTQRWREKRCEDGGRDWRDVTTAWEGRGSHQKPAETRDGSYPWASGGRMSPLIVSKRISLCCYEPQNWW